MLLGSGSAIPPADCLVNDGRIEVDQSAMTGESMAGDDVQGSSCKMGSMVTRGEVEATVQHTGENTFLVRQRLCFRAPTRWVIFQY